MKKTSLVLFCAAGMIAGELAQATTFTISGSVGGAPTGQKYVNFNDLTVGAVPNSPVTSVGNNGSVKVSGTTDGVIATLPNTGQYAAPYVSGGNGTLFGDNNNNQPDSTKYLSTGVGTIKIDFGASGTYIGLLWGSIDTYNTLEFYNSSDVKIGQVTGSQVLAGANGNQGVNGTLYVNITSSDPFQYVRATSSQYAFEFDNVAYNAPDGGSTCALLGMGLLSVGALRRKLNRA